MMKKLRLFNGSKDFIRTGTPTRALSSKQSSVKCGVSEMPVIGLGTWQSKPGVVGAAVEHALKSGYRHIDCAMVYENEEEIGASFAKVFESGIVKRDEVFVTSKLWNTFHRAEDVPGACEKSLLDLGLECLDLYLVHWPISLEPGMGFFPMDESKRMYSDTRYPSLHETWAAMEKLVEEGKCKNIGLSNFNKAQIEKIMSVAKIKPACLQAESHPQLPNLELLDFCKAQEMAFVAYSPLGNPGNAFKRLEQVSLLEDKLVRRIAEKHGVTVAQILIRYQLDKGNAVIPKSVKPFRIEENLAVFRFSLDAEDMVALNGIRDKFEPFGYRTANVLHYKKHPQYPFREELAKL